MFHMVQTKSRYLTRGKPHLIKQRGRDCWQASVKACLRGGCKWRNLIVSGATPEQAYIFLQQAIAGR